MKVVDVAQGSQEWLAWRSTRITGTASPVVLGISPYKTPWQLWAQYTGLLAPDPVNPHMLRGKKYEDLARQKAEELLGDFLVPQCIEMESNPLFAFSGDGFALDNTVVELKCPSERVFEAIRAQRENHPAFKTYRVQTQHGMMCARAPRGLLLFCLVNEADNTIQDYLEFWQAPDEALWAEIQEKGQAFWDHVTNQTEPPLDPERDVARPPQGDEDQWTSQVQAWRAAKRQLERLDGLKKAREERVRKAEEALIGHLGSASALEWDGMRLVRYASRGPVNWKAFVETTMGPVDESTLANFRHEPSFRTRMTDGPKTSRKPTARRSAQNATPVAEGELGMFSF